MNSVHVNGSATPPGHVPKVKDSSGKILVVSDDHRRLGALKSGAREAGYAPVLTRVKDTLASLEVHDDFEFIFLDMRHSRNRCALGLLLKWCFPRIPLILITVSVRDCFACGTCPAKCHSLMVTY